MTPTPDAVAPSAGMTWFDLVRLSGAVHGFTEADLDDLTMDVILWEQTAFPMADAAYVSRQLDAFFADAATKRDGQP